MVGCVVGCGWLCCGCGWLGWLCCGCGCGLCVVGFVLWLVGLVVGGLVGCGRGLRRGWKGCIDRPIHRQVP